MADVEKRIQELGFELPASTALVANYVGAVRVGNLVFVSGHGPVRDGKIASSGKLGRDLSVDAGYVAAQLAILNCLSTLKREVQDLDKVTRIVKLLAMVTPIPISKSQ